MARVLSRSQKRGASARAKIIRSGKSRKFKLPEAQLKDAQQQARFETQSTGKEALAIKKSRRNLAASRGNGFFGADRLQFNPASITEKTARVASDKRNRNHNRRVRNKRGVKSLLSRVTGAGKARGRVLSI